MPIVSCFKRLSICISFRFYRLWAAVHSIRKKSVIIIYTSHNIKPLHRAVGSPISSHYGSLVWEWECTCNTKCAFKLFGRLFTVPYFFVRSFRYTCSASYRQWRPSWFSNEPRGRASRLIALVGGGEGEKYFSRFLPNRPRPLSSFDTHTRSTARNAKRSISTILWKNRGL